MTTNPVKPENSIFKGTEMVYCPIHDDSFEENTDTSLKCKNYKSNKKEDIWGAGLQLWRDWASLEEVYKALKLEIKDMKREKNNLYNERKSEVSSNNKLTTENKALKEQINKQHEELQEIKKKLKELLNQ